MILSRPWVVSSHTCTEQMSIVLWVLSSLWSFVPRTLAALVSPDSQPLSSAREPAELCWAPSLSRVLETQITGLTLFLSCLSDIAVLCSRMSSVFKPIVACISSGCLVVSGGEGTSGPCCSIVFRRGNWPLACLMSPLGQSF